MGRVRNFLRQIRFRVVLPLYQKILVWRLRRKKKINVVFIASTLAMWRYQNIYELMCRHRRFNASIVILPFSSYSQEQQANDVAKLKTYFDLIDIKYYVGDVNTTFDIRKQLHPDILFYPQPYINNYPPKYDYFNFRDRLLCYYPYAFWMSTGDWSFNYLFHNCAWKLFYSTDLHRMDAKKYADNKGCNVEVVGYPNADEFLYKKHCYLWKTQKIRKKRVIWAPYFLIFPGPSSHRSNFLWMSNFMLELADRYAEKIQFVFKPHPRLITELYKHIDWGKERADNYFNEWINRENTQLEMGDFIDLFMTSDAMIHDCGSFCVEYHYSGKPVMYVADNFELQVAEKSEFGKLAMKQQYVGKSEDDIVNFIEDVVLRGDDPMKHGREEFYNQYLLPPNGKTVAENTMDIFLKTFC